MDPLAALWNAWLQAPDYWLARWLFERALAAIYFVAFLNAANQFTPLLGDRGLLPVARYVARVPFRRGPSLFYLHYSDAFFRAVAWIGVALAGLLALGIPQAGPLGLAMLAWLILWALYLSIANVGQRFYAFGWESLLLEAGFLASFLGPSNVAPPAVIVWLFRWLLFRVEFGAGLIKLRGDSCWRDLTCLNYHHETQPLPNPLSWYFHHLPKTVHRLEVLGNHVAQLVLPFGLFAPQPIAGLAGIVLFAHQGWLVLSGNFSWLNVATMALAVLVLDDRLLGALLPLEHAALVEPTGWYVGLVLGCTALIVGLSYFPARNLLSGRQAMNASFEPLRLVNTYGAFGRITRKRVEVILEGTHESTDTPSTVWREYELKGKPADPRRRPPQVAPYHLRLDWVMWFLPLTRQPAPAWMVTLMERLLENDRATLRLFRRNPFPGSPPILVRASLYGYRFTTPSERATTGAWWVRERLGSYLAPRGRRRAADGPP